MSIRDRFRPCSRDSSGGKIDLHSLISVAALLNLVLSLMPLSDFVLAPDESFEQGRNRGLRMLTCVIPVMLWLSICLLTEVVLSFSRDYLLLKILQEAIYFASPTWAKSLTKFNPQIQDSKRNLDLIYKLMEDSQIWFFQLAFKS